MVFTCRVACAACVVPVLDRLGTVLKHIIVQHSLEDLKSADTSATADSDGPGLSQQDVDAQLLKAFMITDASATDVPIVDTSPGFEVCCPVTSLYSPQT